MIYHFEIANSLEDRAFLIEADDLVSALVKAMDFARTVDEMIKKRFDYDITSTVTAVCDPKLMWADGNGAEQYMDGIAIYVGDEED